MLQKCTGKFISRNLVGVTFFTNAYNWLSEDFNKISKLYLREILVESFLNFQIDLHNNTNISFSQKMSFASNNTNELRQIKDLAGLEVKIKNDIYYFFQNFKEQINAEDVSHIINLRTDGMPSVFTIWITFPDEESAKQLYDKI